MFVRRTTYVAYNAVIQDCLLSCVWYRVGGSGTEARSRSSSTCSIVALDTKIEQAMVSGARKLST